MATNGSISINNGAAETNSANVTIYVTPPSDATGIAYIGFNEDDTSGPDSWIPVSSTASWTLDSSAGGKKVIYAWFMDNAGNASITYTQDDIFLDMTPPSGTISISPSRTRDQTVNVYVNTDAVKMQFSNNGSTWSPEEDPVSVRANWDITTYGGSLANGTRTIWAKFRDGAGNYLTTTNTFIFDNIGPNASITINSGDSATNSSYVKLGIDASDTYSTPYRMQFSNNGGLWSRWYTYATTKLSWPITSSAYGGSTTNGTKRVYVRVMDDLGNVSSSVSDAIVYDTVRPTTAPTINSNTPYTNNPSVIITLYASDDRSGLYQMRFSNNNASWSSWQSYSSTRSSWNMTSATYGGTTTETQNKYVYVQVKDYAGNISYTGYDRITYDITPPTGYFYIEYGNPSSSSYTNAILYFYMTDNLSGVSQRRMYRSGTGWLGYGTHTSSMSWYLPPRNGLKYVYAQFKDGAGNTTGSIYDTITLSETYSSLSRTDIVSADYGYTSYMNSNAIEGDDSFNSSALKPGTVLVYRTSAGRFGKLEVLSYDKYWPVFPPVLSNRIRIKMTTYNSNGSIKVSRTSLYIQGTYVCNLYTGTESSGSGFFWRQNTSTQRDLVPWSGALFAKWK